MKEEYNLIVKKLEEGTKYTSCEIDLDFIYSKNNIFCNCKFKENVEFSLIENSKLIECQFITSRE